MDAAKKNTPVVSGDAEILGNAEVSGDDEAVMAVRMGGETEL